VLCGSAPGQSVLELGMSCICAKGWPIHLKSFPGGFARVTSRLVLLMDGDSGWSKEDVLYLSV